MNKGHIKSGEVVNLQTLKTGMSSEQTFALIKTEDMEVIRMVLPRGKDVMEHSVEGGISVQCIEGEVIFHIGDEAQTLSPSDWLYLKKGQPHAIHAKTDAVLLVTILFTGNE